METQIKRHEPLYLKHRPQALDQLVGQSAVTQTLINAITYDRLCHAYLFTGPRGTGKTSTARILAKSLNCKASDKATATPCQTCASCLEVRRGTSPAVFEIDAASNNSVDDARVLIERAPLVAVGGRYKVYIIDECHMLTKEAFNALLKTIEDPPANVVFVLATTEEHKVLPTIISRCQRLMFRLVTQGDLTAHLRSVADQEQIPITDQALEFIARRSGGGLRDALGLLDQSSLLAAPGEPVDVSNLLNLLGALAEDVLLQMSEQILERRGGELLDACSKLMQDGREPSLIVQELARHFLNLAKCSYLGESDALAAANLILGSPFYIEGLNKQAPQFERSELTQLVEVLDKLEQTIRRSTQPAMHLEVALLSLCHRHDMLLVRELSERVSRLEQALEAGGMTPQAVPLRKPLAASAAPKVVSTTARANPQAQAPASQAAQPQAPAAQAAAPKMQSIPEPDHSDDESDHGSDDHPAVAAVVVADELPEPVAQASPQVFRTLELATESDLAGTTARPAAAQTIPEKKAEPAPQLNVAVAVAADQAPAHEAPPDEVDRVWSQALDELQRRHIPTYSLASVHAVPLSLTDRELTLGTKEALIKSLEPKLDHLRAACASVLGKNIHIRLKPINTEVPSPKSSPARPREPERLTTSAPSAAKPAGDSDEEHDPAASSPRLTGTSSPTLQTQATPVRSQSAPIEVVVAAAQARAASEAAPEPSVSAARDLPTAAPAAAPQSPIAAASPNVARGNDGTVIKEAYKLFEGPGSRQIGRKQP